MTNPLDELLVVTNRKDLTEVGGGHNQKGIEFQRHWAIMHMFELEQSGAKDFLFIFEAIQDVAILDSNTNPTSICVYQIKKKDRKEWGWTDLTALHSPKTSRRSKIKPLSIIQDSPIGKLYATIHAFKEMKSTGRFVSNIGFDLLLADGTNAANSIVNSLSTLSKEHLELLSKGLKTLHSKGESLPDLSRICLERINLPVDDPGTYIIGLVHKFLENRSPRHAGQARSLVDLLLAKIGPLGTKTHKCNSLEEMRRWHGYSKSEFDAALGELETIPDMLVYLDIWLDQLGREGVGVMEITAIRSAAAAIYRRQVLGLKSHDEERLKLDCDEWWKTHSDISHLRSLFQTAFQELSVAHPTIRKPEILAYFALRGISKCVAQN